MVFFAHNFPSYYRPISSKPTPAYRGRGSKRGGQFNNRQQPYTVLVCTYHRCNNTPGQTIEVCRKKQEDKADARNKGKEDNVAMATVLPETKEQKKPPNTDNA